MINVSEQSQRGRPIGTFLNGFARHIDRDVGQLHFCIEALSHLGEEVCTLHTRGGELEPRGEAVYDLVRDGVAVCRSCEAQKRSEERRVGKEGSARWARDE